MKWGALLVALMAAACAAAIGAIVWQGNLPYRGFEQPAIVLVIPQGESARAVAKRLEEAGVVRSALVFRLLMRLRNDDQEILAGEYEFSDGATPSQVLDRLVRGEVLKHRLTIPEGLRLDEVARLVGESGLGDAAAFIKAVSNPRLIADIDPAADDLEGYLFPDTYHLARGIGEEALVAEMVSRLRDELTAERRSRMEAMGLSIRQTLTLASLVEKEAHVADERPRIAGVFHNRLRIGMPLQCDPTVVYALIRDGRYRGDIYRSDLSYRSPYNTYARAGLPPGPICSPGASSIDAVLLPAQTAELYFVASGSGGRHSFSTNMRDHERAVQRYRRELDTLRRR